MRIASRCTPNYDAYTNLGNVLTRYSGGQRYIEIELYFSPDTTAHSKANQNDTQSDLQ